MSRLERLFDGDHLAALVVLVVCLVVYAYLSFTRAAREQQRIDTEDRSIEAEAEEQPTTTRD